MHQPIESLSSAIALLDGIDQIRAKIRCSDAGLRDLYRSNGDKTQDFLIPLRPARCCSRGVKHVSSDAEDHHGPYRE
jgi:hypothetical protein